MKFINSAFNPKNIKNSVLKKKKDPVIHQTKVSFNFVAINVAALLVDVEFYLEETEKTIKIITFHFKRTDMLCTTGTDAL